MYIQNKRKILNDPVYGFVTLPSELVYDLIEHPYFQRLRRVKQLGLTDFVYPGALHSRFQHAIGAMHLMGQVLNSLEAKGNLIMEVEREAAQIAILLHDIGHGPFSHVLEYTLLEGVNHEKITEMIMEKLNLAFDGKLNLAIEMFKNTYHRKFFNQLISSQLDMDRLDYINRDSFFTGVAEGSIGVDRIIKMLDIHEENLVVEEKGLLSVETFLNARRTMYWQVYLHKTAISGEVILIKALERARELKSTGQQVDSPKDLEKFLDRKIGLTAFMEEKETLESFLKIDDIDILSCIKTWVNHKDKVLSFLAQSFLNRKLYKIKLSDESPSEKEINKVKEHLLENGINPKDLKYFFHVGSISNAGYVLENSRINILKKSGEVQDIVEASDLPTIKALGKIVKKHYLCWSKDVYLHF
ncbi:HD domain-containing protein [uncultured Arcticibacterium sp.]|mgnify:CR=1 FL=1|uniref:HD domain-containing protein n=1 Tax=uncultured Arcticibacterium sp. TaxID=2173042 RepID=UPI0030F67EA6